MKRSERAHSNTFMLLAASMNRRTQTDGPCSIKQVHVAARDWESDVEFKCGRKDKGRSCDRGMCSHKQIHALEWGATTTRMKELLAQTNSCYQPLYQ